MAPRPFISLLAALCTVSVGIVSQGVRAEDPFAALPLEVVATTPTDLLKGEDFSLSRGQALQVVFSRPVIRIGADWEDNSSIPQPLLITVKNSAAAISSIASQRWVTTFILRLDPLPEHGTQWPTDLQLGLAWNRSLQTWDGARMSDDHKNSLKVRSHLCECGVHNLFICQVVSQHGMAESEHVLSHARDRIIRIFYRYEPGVSHRPIVHSSVHHLRTSVAHQQAIVHAGCECDHKVTDNVSGIGRVCSSCQCNQ